MRKSGITKTVSLVIMLAMVLAMFGACNTPHASTTPQAASDSPTTAPTPGDVETGQNEASLTKYKEPITLTWMTPTRDENPMDTPARKAIFAKIAEATNVIIDWVLVPSTDSAAMYTTTLLSGKDSWPNIMTAGRDIINTDGKDGAFVDLTDLIQEKMPNAFEKLNAYDRWNSIVHIESGRLYAIPRIGQQECRTSWMIREDWLEACGLSMPTTAEEYADALRAFKTQNPGNVPADQNYPFIARGNPQSWMCTVFGSWGMHSTYYTEFEDGRIELNLRLPEFRECMEYWHGLYEEGLIDPEIAVGDANRWLSYMNNSYSGATIDYTVRTNQFTGVIRNPSEDAVAAGVQPQPEAALIGLTPLTAGGRTKTTIMANDPIYPYTCIGIMNSCTQEQIDAAMCLINYIYSDEGAQLLSWGVDGDTYNGLDADGNPVWDESLIGENYSMLNSAERGIQPEFARPVTKAEVLMLFPGLAGEASSRNDGYYEPAHSMMYLTEEEWTEHGEILAELSTLYVEACAQFLTGDRSLDDAGWEKFQKDLDAYNADRFIELTRNGINNAKDMLKDFQFGN